MSSSLNCSHTAIVLLIQINLFSAAGSSPVLSSSAHSDFISCFSGPITPTSSGRHTEVEFGGRGTTLASSRTAVWPTSDTWA
ncbi:hypothetical protein PF010_g3109 [Phytophthora fragariae]|uniref:Secreted protein n=2 Tax=Phytophthora fragariae TaxID=53985 RepID=A0A6G0LVR8_9STRA|nr:hypothetical protein PF010_g3109 [Phytophthora fragariae]